MLFRSGQAEPLAGVARDVAAAAKLLCLDEFHITDITDAMLMRKLLEGLMSEGVVVLTTSNFEPDALYLHGLQRNQFLPAIDLIKQNFDVVNVDGGIDYRLRELEKAGVYHTSADSDERMAAEFIAIARHEVSAAREIEIEGRSIPVRRDARDVVWFDFAALCDGPRGKHGETARRRLQRHGNGQHDRSADQQPSAAEAFGQPAAHRGGDAPRRCGQRYEIGDQRHRHAEFVAHFEQERRAGRSA